MSDFVYSASRDPMVARRPPERTPVFTPAASSDRVVLRGLDEFLRKPYVRVNAPPVGVGATTQGSGAEVKTYAPPPVPSTSGTAPPGGVPNPFPPMPTKNTTRAAMRDRTNVGAAAPRPTPPVIRGGDAAPSSPVIEIFEDDDLAMAAIDVDAVVQQQRRTNVQPASTAAPTHTPAPQHAAHQSNPPNANANASARTGPAKAPALDGSGLDWRCEHGCAMRHCARLMDHMDALKELVDMYDYQLGEDDALENMTGKEYKETERKLREGREMQHGAIRAAMELGRSAGGSGGSGGSGTGGSMPPPASRPASYGAPTYQRQGNPPAASQFQTPQYNQQPQQQYSQPPQQQQQQQQYNQQPPTQQQYNQPQYPSGQESYQTGTMPPGPGDATASYGGGGHETGGHGGGDLNGGNGGAFQGDFGRPGPGNGNENWDNGGGDFGPAPGDRAASIAIPEDCQFVDHQIKRWMRDDFEWSSRARQVLRNTFNAQDFRGMQLATINCTMSCEDSLVLMPTGGGKSLCYQLPAVLSPGVTIVISPLVSLIQDQLHHLSEMGIPAGVLGSMEKEGAAVQNQTYAQLRNNELKLLYLTPEKIAKSNKLMNLLEQMHGRGELSRIVVDEVHCISSWGHDFRKDYQALRILKNKFRDVPLVGLTATATKRVQDDCVRQLGLQKCTRFFQTFNRTNIVYEVKPKSKDIVKDMKALIHEKFTNHRNGKVQCGIVYCFSQKDCEKMAEALTCKPKNDARWPKGLLALPYHAGMTETDRKTGVPKRELHQRMWSDGKLPIICATVAFGMGINKPDVRFVFHHSIPKSLEGYHQESGRAGRDGGKSYCTLFYQAGDAVKMRALLQNSAKETRAPPEILRSNLEAMAYLEAYCTNQTTCRRTLLLGHFDERFDAAKCKGMCDNCQDRQSGAMFEDKDMTAPALAVCQVIHGMGYSGGTKTGVWGAFSGSKAKDILNNGYDRLPGYGVGKKMKITKPLFENLLIKIIADGFVQERTTRNNGPFGGSVTHLHADQRRLTDLQGGRTRVVMQTKLTKAQADQRRGESREAAASRGELPTAPANPAKRTPAQQRTQAPRDIDAMDDFIYPASTPAHNAAGAGIDGNNNEVVLMDTTPVAEEAEMSKEMGIRYDALFEALFTMRDELAEQRSKRDGKSVRNYMVCSETCLQALARAAAGGGCATLEEVKKLTTFTDAAWNVFIRQHHQKIWATMVKTRRVLDNPELMADIGAASANFEAFEYVATQQRDGPGAGVKRSQSDLDPSPTWQKAKR